jgi:hypothetical protein
MMQTMTLSDLRGNPSGSGSSAARDHAERALWRMMSFYDTPLADLDAAIEADPGWALPHAMKAGFLLSLTEPSLIATAAAHLQAAHALEARHTLREGTHLQALQQVLEGRWAEACRTWDVWLIDHPRDALALQWAHLWDFYRGDAPALRQRPARALPEWDESDPLYAHVLALHAFGLEECNLHAQAEDTARRALQLDPGSPWAIHAAAHVMEMQGRFDEGSAWLRQHQGAWAQGNGMAAHLYWHKALFRLEALDTAGALRLADSHLSGASLEATLQRVDAASLLWRLHLLGQDVQARAQTLVAGWLGSDCAPQPGHYAFNDAHLVMGLLMAGEHACAEAWVAQCAQQALAAGNAAQANHRMARDVGLPLMRGLLAWARGDADAAVETLYPVRAAATLFGGSHAQRDVIDQTLIAASARSRRPTVGRALLNERRLAKPVTPLTRHWIEQMGLPEAARA